MPKTFGNLSSSNNAALRSKTGDGTAIRQCQVEECVGGDQFAVES